MDLLSYQRTVFGFHGCDRRVAEDVLSGKRKLTASLNTYDWLGMGIYFWNCPGEKPKVRLPCGRSCVNGSDG